MSRDDAKTRRDGLRAALRLDPARADLWFQLGGLEEQLGDLEGAAEAYLKASEHAPENSGYQLDASRVMCVLLPNDERLLLVYGEELLEAGDVAAAVQVIDRAARLPGATWKAHVSLAEVLIDAGDLEKAIDACEHVIGGCGIGPLKRDALNLKGVALLRSHRPDAALAAFDEALAMVPSTEELLLGRADALRDLKRWGEALDAYERLDLLCPTSFEACAGRSFCLAELGDRAGAIAAQRREVERAPQIPDSHFNLGTLCLEVGEFDQAVSSLSRAIELDPDHRRAIANRAEAHLGLGRCSEAIADARRALSLDPTDHVAKQVLAAASGSEGSSRA